MFIGHFGIGFGAKKYAPKLSLGTLFIAAQFLDLLWPTLLLLNVEHVEINTANAKVPLNFTDYPISHSLLVVLLWSFLFAGLGWLIRKDARTAVILGLCVLSHWILDLIVHFPDLPLYPGNSPKLGFSLWVSVAGSAVVEGIIFILGLVWYLQCTRAKNAAGKWGFWLLAGLLVLSHVSSLFGPVPPSVKAIAWTGQLQWIFVILAYWVDHNRRYFKR
jgi:FtsH-binding integral membrane protein